MRVPAKIVITFVPESGELKIEPFNCSDAETLAILHAGINICVGKVFNEAKDKSPIVMASGPMPSAGRS